MCVSFAEVHQTHLKILLKLVWCVANVSVPELNYVYGGLGVGGGSGSSSWNIAGLIAGPVLVVCVFVASWCLLQMWRDGKRARGVFLPGEDSLCEPQHPIMGAATIRDMIELTTSGSGSGNCGTSVYSLPSQ